MDDVHFHTDSSLENSPRAVESIIPPLSPGSVVMQQTPTQADDVDIVQAPLKEKRGKIKKLAFVWKDEVVYHLVNFWQQESVLFSYIYW